MKKNLPKILVIMLIALNLCNPRMFSQVLISNSTGTPNSNAMLEIQSTDKGMLIPRVSTANRLAITPTPGLLVFDSGKGSFFLYGKTADGSSGWIDLSTDAGIWTRTDNNVYLSSSNYNVGIGTSTPKKKLVIKAQNTKDTLLEIQDMDGHPLMVITPTLTKFNIVTKTKGTAGGFAVGRYSLAKEKTADLMVITEDSTRVYTGTAGGFAVGRYSLAKDSLKYGKYFFTNVDSTRIYTSNSKTKGTAGGFAVGRYSLAKGNVDTTIYFSTNEDNTRVYTGTAGGFAVGRYSLAKGVDTTIYFSTSEDSTRVYTGTAGGFAVGRYSLAKKSAKAKKYFFTNIDSTRVYTDGSGVKGTAGGFAVGRYSLAKGSNDFSFFTKQDSTRVYVPDGGTGSAIGGFAVTGINASAKDDYFNVTGNTNIDTVDNKRKVMWYPLKSALLGGEIHVASVDSVGENSVALGYRPISMGDWSQAFGYQSKALGTYSTAMGYKAEADINSLAVGYLAKAQGNSSFAMGYGAIASGNNSYALGSTGLDSAGVVTINTQAIGEYSFAFGLGSVSSGKGSVAFGTTNTASGEYSTAIGYENQATKYYTTSMGAHSQAVGDYSTAIGFYNQATNTASSALGYNTIAAGNSSLAAGRNTNAGGYTSFAMGYKTQVPGNYSVSLGYFTDVSSSYSLASGRSTTSAGDYSLVFGHTSSTNASGDYSLAGGYLCTANSQFSVALGRQCQTTGSYAAAIGYINTASNLYTVALGHSTTASGENAFSTGRSTTASGNYTMTAGLGTEAKSYMSAVFGRYNKVAGTTNSWVTTEQLFVVGNGSAGIPHNALTIYKNGILNINDNYSFPNVDGSNGQILQTNGSGTVSWASTSNLDNDWTVSGSNMYSAVTGNVGIGTSAPTQKLQINGNVYASGGDFYAATTNGVINCGGGIMSAAVNVISDGTLNNGYATGDEDLYINDALEVDGAAYKTGTGTWTIQSDKRLKKEIREYKDGLNQILKINPVYFKYNEKAGVNDTNKEYVGIIAQDIKTVAPYTVELTPFNKVEIEDENGNVKQVQWDGTSYYTFNPSALTYMLINGMKEQQTQIEQQNKKIENLEKQIQELKDLIKK